MAFDLDVKTSLKGVHGPTKVAQNTLVSLAAGSGATAVQIARIGGLTVPVCKSLSGRWPNFDTKTTGGSPTIKCQLKSNSFEVGLEITVYILSTLNACQAKLMADHEQKHVDDYKKIFAGMKAAMKADSLYSGLKTSLDPYVVWYDVKQSDAQKVLTSASASIKKMMDNAFASLTAASVAQIDTASEYKRLQAELAKC